MSEPSRSRWRGAREASPPWTAIGRALVRSPRGGLCLTEPLAAVVAGGRIAAVAPAGRHDDPSAVRSVGHRDAVLMPALADSHLHLVATAASRVGIDLSVSPPRSSAALRLRLESAAAETAPGKWVRVVGFEPFWLGEGREPNRTELDDWLPRHPLRLRHATRHASFLNSAAFDRLVRALGPLAPERAARDAAGRFAGVVYGLERELTELVGPLSSAEIDAGLRATSAELALRGVARIDEPSGSNDAGRVALLATAIERGDVVQSLRVFVGDADEVEAAEQAARGRLEIAGVKLFVHAAEEATSAGFVAALARARRAGLPVAVHAVEADCVAAVAEALGAAPRRAPRQAQSHARRLGAVAPAAAAIPDRIEHASLCPPELARSLARLGIAIVTQPGFLVARGAKYRAEVEPALWPWLYAIRSHLAAGVLVAAGSDAPVGPADPRLGFRGAIDRSAPGEEPIAPEEAIDDATALELYTGAAARLRGESGSSDWLAPGSRADLAILDGDPTRSRWQDLEAIAIMVAGAPFRVGEASERGERNSPVRAPWLVPLEARGDATDGWTP